MLKYGFDDARDVLERASARETAARVAAGTLAKLLLPTSGSRPQPHRRPRRRHHRPPTAPGPRPAISRRSTTTRCAASTPTAEKAMIAAVKAAAKVGDSLGGVAEVLAYGVPVGLGSHVHWDRKLDATWPRRS